MNYCTDFIIHMENILQLKNMMRCNKMKRLIFIKSFIQMANAFCLSQENCREIFNNNSTKILEHFLLIKKPYLQLSTSQNRQQQSGIILSTIQTVCKLG